MAKSDRQGRNPVKRALITGIGPDGSYLAKLPLKGYVALFSQQKVYFCWASTRNRGYGLGQRHLVQSRIPRHGGAFMTRNLHHIAVVTGADRCANADAPAAPRIGISIGALASVRGMIDRAMVFALSNNLNRVNACMDGFLARIQLTC